MSDDTGSAITVVGRIDPGDLGVVLPHEHTFIDLIEAWFTQPDSAVERSIAREPVSIENLWYIRRNPLDNKDNGRLESMEEAIEEYSLFHQAGGGAVVDVTPKNVGGDPERVRQVSRATGIPFIHGTSYYTEPAHPRRLGDMSIDGLAEEFTSDVQEGIDQSTVRAGMVGEIGVSDTIYDGEEKVLRGGARAAAATGAPLNVHPPGRSPEAHQGGTRPTSLWALEILDILEEEGLPPDRVVMSHMDRTRLELEPESLGYQRQLADRGAYIEYDLWGTEMYQEKFGNGWPSDPERISAVETLIEDGYADRLLFSHDVCMKVQRRQYGGFGYSHLLTNVRPMLESRSISSNIISEIMSDNPQQLLTFVEPM